MDFETEVLGNLLKDKGYIRGPFGSALKRTELKKYGIPVYEQQHAIYGLRVFRFFVEEIKFKELKRFCVQPNDLIISCSGTIGKVSIIKKHDPIGIISQALLILRPDTKKIIPQFLLYFLSSKAGYNEFVAASHGSVQINIAPRAIVENIKVPLPEVSEQVKITQILGALDNKIELNHKMNGTLEAIARAIFKSWFIDFDPVRAKMEGRVPYGMDAEIAALFPESFEDSAIGEIPKGWEIVTIGDVVALNKRTITKGFPFQEIDYIDISSVTEGRLEGTTSYNLNEAPSRAKRLVKDGDIIWSTVRPNRKSFLLIIEPKDNLVVSTGFVVLTPLSIPSSYLYSWVTTDQFVDYLAFNADGSAYPAVLPSRFADALILLPSQELLQKFEQIVGSFRTLIAQNEKEDHTLTAIRDTLLPKLLSGEIRVKDAEKLVEASV